MVEIFKKILAEILNLLNIGLLYGGRQMINTLWFIMIAVGCIVAVINGRVDYISGAIFQAVHTSVDLIIKLLGPMALWLGIMNIARESKLTEYISNFLKPFIKFLFPDIPDTHPAVGAIVLNMTANILGLGNSSTPLGIKAMLELQELNKNSEKASFAMCTLLALNTSSITIVPAMIISLRAASGSNDPSIIITTTIFATGISTITAILLDKIFRIFSVKMI